MNKKLAGFTVGALVIGLGAGFALGFAPYYAYMNSPAGGPGKNASLLTNAAQMLNDGPSHSLSADEVLKKQVRLANEYTINGALYYCAMQPQYRAETKKAVALLDANQNVSASSNKDAAQARAYILKASSDTSGCSNFAVTGNTDSSTGIAEVAGR